MTTLNVPAEVPSGSSGNYFVFQPPDAIPDVYNLRLFAIRELRDYSQHLAGGILRVIDAMGLSDKQFDAIKALIFAAIWDDHYAPALAWAHREASLEQKESIPGVGWQAINAHRLLHPPPEFNVFPFSVTATISVTATT